jgi:hypothetical protein
VGRAYALVEVLLALDGDHGQQQEKAAIASGFGDAALMTWGKKGSEKMVAAERGDEQADDVGAAAGELRARRRAGYSDFPG